MVVTRICIQLKIFELAKKELGGTLNALLEFICLVWLQLASEVLDVALNVSHKCFIVKCGLLLEAKGVNNVNNPFSLVINTLIFTTLGRWIGTNIHIDSSFDDPLALDLPEDAVKDLLILEGVGEELVACKTLATATQLSRPPKRKNSQGK